MSHPDREIPHIELSLAGLPRFALGRAGLSLARARGTADLPWITRDAIEVLSTVLRRTDRGLEFGSGGSTIWLARRSQSVISVEAFPRWHSELAARLKQDNIHNVELILVSADALGHESPAHREAYMNVRPDLASESLDWVFVDGEYRDLTAMRALDLLKIGGLLILDNANSYLPAPSHAAWKVHQPASPIWQEFLERVASWRMIWTSNGTWDTAIWIKA